MEKEIFFLRTWGPRLPATRYFFLSWSDAINYLCSLKRLESDNPEYEVLYKKNANIRDSEFENSHHLLKIHTLLCPQFRKIFRADFYDPELRRKKAA